MTINTAKKLLLEERSFWSGLEGRVLTNDLADVLNVPPKTLGYLVRGVAKGSPAEAVGLGGGTKLATIDGEQIAVGGDIILKVLGVPVGSSVADYEKVREAIAAVPPAGTITVTVLPAGRVMDLGGKRP